MLVLTVRSWKEAARGSCATSDAARAGAAEDPSCALAVVEATTGRNCAGGMGVVATAIVPRSDVLLRRLAEVG